jgi:TatD DNase family protein
MIFDTHIHLNDEKLIENLDQEISEAREVGVSKFLCVGFDIESSKKAVQIADKYDCVFAAVGIIPTEHEQYDANTINEIRKIALSSKKVKAIGEIGLDYYWEKDDETKTIQKEMFLKQIDLANELNLPISIHARDSLSDILEILKKHPVKQAGIMHCYSGSTELAKEFVKLGYKIAFGGVLTFKNSKKTKEVFKDIGLENAVFETDAPYLSPEPNRGKINLPKYIADTVKFAANTYSFDLNELEKIAFENSLNILHVEKNEK